MIYYKIIPRCNEQLVLTLNTFDDNNVAELQPYSTQEADRDKQLWTPVEIISGDDKGFALLNKSSRKFLAAPKDKALLTQIDPDRILQSRAIWKFKGLGYGAIQLQANNDMNLNASGNGPYVAGNKVGVWDWSQGANNEVWQMKLEEGL